MRHYANETTAARAIESRRACRCYSCDGSGTRTYPDTMQCIGCDGSGQQVIDAAPGDVIPKWARYRGLADRESGIVCSRVLVLLTTNGYAVVTDASLTSAHGAMLPPTYTPDVLSRPI
jgi:hypothetical protein